MLFILCSFTFISELRYFYFHARHARVPDIFWHTTFFSLYLFLYLSVYLSVYLSAYCLSVCLSVCLSLFLSLSLPSPSLPPSLLLSSCSFNLAKADWIFCRNTYFSNIHLTLVIQSGFLTSVQIRSRWKFDWIFHGTCALLYPIYLHFLRSSNIFFHSFPILFSFFRFFSHFIQYRSLFRNRFVFSVVIFLLPFRFCSYCMFATVSSSW